MTFDTECDKPLKKLLFWLCIEQKSKHKKSFEIIKFFYFQKGKMFQIRTLNVRSLVTSIKCFDLSLKILPLRTFYAEQELGVDSIKRMRQQIFGRFEKRNDVNSHKRNLIKNFSNSSLDKRSDHLKELILLLDKNPDDLNMLKSILVQYQNTTTTSTNNNNDVNNNQQTEFCFGTSLMRMFYLLDFPDGAVEVIKYSKKFNLLVFFALENSSNKKL